MSDLSEMLPQLSADKLALLARRLRAETRAPASEPDRTTTDRVPLSFTQRRMWSHEQLEPGTPVFNAAIALELEGELRVGALAAAFDRVTDRHPLLRARLVGGSEPSLAIAPHVVVPLSVAEVSALAPEPYQRRLDRLITAWVRRPFDLASAPLFRVLVLRRGGGRGTIAICFHHLIFDAWSAGVLVREVCECYAARLQRRRPQLPPPPSHYAEYVAAERQRLAAGELEPQLAYWSRQLDALPAPIDLGIGRARPATRSERGSVRYAALDAATVARLRDRAAHDGATVFMVLLAAFQLLVLRLSGASDLVIGSSVSGRSRRAWEGIIGPFVNTVAVRVDASGDPTFRDLVRRVRAAALETLTHSEVPFDRVLDRLKVERTGAATPVFQLAFVLQNTPSPSIRLPGLTVTPRPLHNGTSPYDLFLLAEERGDDIALTAEYGVDRFDASTIDGLLQQYAAIVRSALAQPDARLSRVPLLDAAAASRVVRDFNHAEAADTAGATIHAVFECRAAAAPERIAVEHADRHVTYGELNRIANRLARALRARGVGPDVVVGVYVERSIELIAIVLAILKSGGAYLYLDPEHPPERVADLIERSQPAVVIAAPLLADRLPRLWAPLVELDRSAAAWPDGPASDLDVDVAPTNLAYVIHTSGTTGTPKGVMVPHGGVVRLAQWQRRYFGVDPTTRVSQVAAYSFDAAVGETFMALANGATLVMAEERPLDPAAFDRFVRTAAVSVVVAVPSLLRHVDPARLAGQRPFTVVSVGEACADDLARRWSSIDRFVNAYGPTEYTVYSHAWDVARARPGEARRVPIGDPIGRTRSYVLDRCFAPQPVGVVGELYIAGVGTARGYEHAPAATASRFVPNPFADLVRFSHTDATAAAVNRFRQRVGARQPVPRDQLDAMSSGETVAWIEQHCRHLDADLAAAARGYARRLAADPCALAAFRRYTFEAFHDSYAACELDLEFLTALIGADLAGLSGVEFGFGRGETLATLAAAGVKVVGLDLSPFFVQRARRRGLDVRLAKADVPPDAFARECGLAPESLDFAFCSLLLDRLEDPRAFLANMLGTLKRGGRFAVLTAMPIVAADGPAGGLVYAPPDRRISRGVDVDDDTRAVIEALHERGALDVEVRTFPYAVVSGDGYEEYQLHAFLGRTGRPADRAAVCAWSRMYRTGDLARYLPDGSIEYCGRVDDQIKIRGCRIDPAEIAAAVSRYDGVADVHVTARPDDAGQPILVAYVVPSTGPMSAGERDAFAASLRRFLHDRLPRHMIPSHVIALGALPLSSNGKVDARQLPAPDATPTAAKRRATSAMGAILIDVCRSVLKLDELGLDDNLFQVGADSILIVQIIGALRDRGLVLTIDQFFRHQTIAALEEIAAPAAAPVGAVAARDDAAAVPLTPIQRWLLDQPDPSSTYNLSVWLRAGEPMSASRLRRAAAAVSARHEALRLRLGRDAEGGWVQHVASVDADAFAIVDLDALPAAVRRETARRVATDAQRSVSWSRGPMFRVIELTCGAGEPPEILAIAHHAAVDAIAWTIVAADLASAYRDGALPPATGASFSAWACALDDAARRGDLDADRRYWADRPFGRARALPRDFTAGADDNTEASAATVGAWLGRRDTKALLDAVGGAAETRPQPRLVGAVAQACAAWAGHDAVLVDVETHGRSWAPDGVDITRTVGWFTALVPVLLAPDRRDDPAAWAADAARWMDAAPRSGSTCGVGDEPRLRRVRPEIGVNYLGRMQERADASLFTLVERTVDGARAATRIRPYAFEITAHVQDDRLRIELRYSKKLHAAGTASALLAAIVANVTAMVRDVAAPRSFALTPMQRGIFLQYVANPASAVYHNQMCFRVRGGIDHAAIARAWNTVVARHAALRSAFTWTDGETPLQHDAGAIGVPIETADWSALDADAQRQRLEAFLARDRERGFVLSEAPLMRLFLATLDPQTIQVVWSFHHVLADGWSVAIVLREVAALCADAGAALHPSAPPDIFRRYVEWLGARDASDDEAFWRRALDGAAATPLPIGKPLPPGGQTCAGDEVALPLDAVDTKRILTTAKERGWTLSTLASAAWAAVLARFTASDDVVFGLTVSGRASGPAPLDAAVGLFINTLPLRVRVDRGTRVRAWLDALQLAVADATAHGACALAQIQRWSGSPLGLFETVVIVENYPLDRALMTPGGLRIEQLACLQRSSFPATLLVAPGDPLSLRLMFDASRLSATAARQLLDGCRIVLRQIASGVERMGDLWADAEAPPAETRGLDPAECLHAGFAALARTSPDAVAVEDDDGSITYGALNQRANTLAGALAAAGVGPERIVGVLVRRGVDAYTALLGILKAGGAFMPLDAAEPAPRLADLLREAGASAVVTQDRFAHVLSSAGIPVVSVDAIGRDARAAAPSPSAAMGPENLAYVMYTSGSTGKRKGILGLHRSTMAVMHWRWRDYPFAPNEVCCQKTSLCFGDSIVEAFGPLLRGVRTVVVADDVVRDPRRFVRRLAEAEVSRLILVPTLLREILEAVPNLAAALPRLQLWIASGEMLPRALAQRFAAVMPHATLINLYGAGEVANDVTHGDAAADTDGTSAPIGVAIAGARVQVLGADLAPVPAGAPGQLTVGGAILNRGYLRRPDLTAAAFIPDPFGGAGARLYRTGDIGRDVGGGVLECRGRVDHQIKVAGRRVELDEIGAALDQHAAIQKAVIIAPRDAEGHPRLAAYILPTHQQRLLASPRCYRLPNGAPLLHVNKRETDFQYQEIFDDQVYASHGITLAADACVLDVGANIGMFTLWVRVHRPAARIIAVEPNPDVVPILRDNVTLYGGRADVLACGVSDRAGRRRFVGYRHASLLSGFATDGDRDRRLFKAAALAAADPVTASALDEMATAWFDSSPHTVETRTVSDLVRDLGVDRIDLLKIDVERSELDVLRGIGDGDWRRIRQIVMEVEDVDGRLADVQRLLRARGYDVVAERAARFPDTSLYNVYAIAPAHGADGADRDWTCEAAFPAAADLSPDALRQFLTARLPPYMIPATYALVDEFPLTISGKIDRVALAARGGAHAGQQPSARPLSALEQQLIEIWSELLGVARVGVRDNLFEMGADSLLVTRAQERMRRRIDEQLTVVDMYRYPTIAELAAHIGGREVPPAADDAVMRERSAKRRQWSEAQAARRPATIPQ